jgi:short-subunit dehydrogenase
MGDQLRGQEDFAEARQIIEVNYLSYISLLHHAASHFEKRRSGFICALSSVAGDRGRQSNYLYGSSKGALTLYLQGLRNRLSKSGVAVITVKPGIVDTKMTFGKEGLLLMAKPATIASGVFKAVMKRKHSVYLPGFWRWIMLIIRHIPESIFKRMSL